VTAATGFTTRDRPGPGGGVWHPPAALPWSVMVSPSVPVAHSSRVVPDGPSRDHGCRSRERGQLDQVPKTEHYRSVSAEV
jgi:hypothetical protein